MSPDPTAATTVLVAAAQLLTLADGPADAARAGAAQSELGLRRGHSVILTGDRITWVGPESQRPPTPGATEIDCRGRTITRLVR